MEIENLIKISGVIISIATFINAVMTIVNFVGRTKKTTDTAFDKKVKEVVEPMIEPIKKDVEDLKKESKLNEKERKLLLKAQLACLKGLKEQGCNGPVTESIEEIENYLIEK